MKRFCAIAMTLYCVSVLFLSCQKAPELTLTGPSSIELSADGSSGTITFTANREWKVSCSDTWVSVSPSSGTATDGTVTVTVRCNANTTYEDRTATVTIKMEELSQTVTVKQPANLGIILPMVSFNLASDTKSLEVSLQANVQYTVSISDYWIKHTGTKGLVSNTLTFSVDENTSYDARSATITIKAQNGSVPDQVISVTQAQKDALIVKDSNFEMPYGGGGIEVKVEANVDFDVKPREDWIQYVETKALGNSTIYLTVKENETYSAREGKVEITQKNGSLKHTVTVKQAGRIAVTSVTLNKSSLKLKEGESEKLTATVKPDNATDKTVTWSSSDESVATVDNEGTVSAIKAGTANISATAGEKTAKCAVTVYKEIPVTSLELNKTTLSLVAGETASLVATVKPDDATDKTVTWNSYDTSIATVNSEGKVTAVGKGSTTITASAGNYSSSCKVFVKAASYPTPYGATDLGLSVIWGEKNLGATSAYDAGGYYLWGDPTGTGVIAFFDTPNTNYICDTQYDIARKQLGKGWRLPTREEIKELLSSCSWETVSNGVRLTGPNGNSVILPLTGMAYPADGAVGSISISSKDKGYMMTGESYADSYGRFAYVYHYNQSFSYNWSSYNAPMAKFPVRPVFESLDGTLPAESISVTPLTADLTVGETITLTATVYPTEASISQIAWSSSNQDIATVNNSGVVEAKSFGVATITAKADDLVGTCRIIVSAPDDVWDGTVASSFAQQGSGSKDNPYIITTCSQLAKLAQQVNEGNSFSGKYFQVVASLDLNSNPFTAIGTEDAPFSGHFNGGGKYISTVSITSGSNIGFFGVTQNAYIDDMNLRVGMGNSNSQHVGGLVGYAKSTVITNCTTKGFLAGFDCAGGLVGYLDSGSSIKNSYSSCQNTLSQINGSVGGLVGYNCGEMSCCYFYGSINASSYSSYSTGGIVGYNHTTAQMHYCYYLKFPAGIMDIISYCGSLNWGACDHCGSFDTNGYISGTGYIVDVFNGWVNSHQEPDVYYRNWKGTYPQFVY